MKINRIGAPQKMTAAPAANFAKEPRAKQEKSGRAPHCGYAGLIRPRGLSAWLTRRNYSTGQQVAATIDPGFEAVQVQRG